MDTLAVEVVLVTSCVIDVPTMEQECEKQNRLWIVEVGRQGNEDLLAIKVMDLGRPDVTASAGCAVGPDSFGLTILQTIESLGSSDLDVVPGSGQKMVVRAIPDDERITTVGSFEGIGVRCTFNECRAYSSEGKQHLREEHVVKMD